MLKLALTIIILSVPALAQNPSWERWKRGPYEGRRAEREELARVNAQAAENAAKARVDAIDARLRQTENALAELKGSLKWSDRLLWLSLTGSGGLVANAGYQRLKRKGEASEKE